MTARMTADEAKAELARLNRLMFLALSLGFHDEVRHWKAKRTELVQQMRDQRSGGSKS